MTKTEKILKFSKADIYPVITEKFCLGRSSLDILKAVLDAGVSVVQLREKDKDSLEIFRIAEKFRKLTSDAGSLLIINDRIDIALGVHADGVHLGQSDFPYQKASEMWPDLLIGVSTHNPEEIQHAITGGANIINIGPVFQTNTKEKLSSYVGLELLKEWIPRATVPFSVMGGIKEQNISQVKKAGATTFAMVTEITEAADIGQKIKRLRSALNG